MIYGRVMLLLVNFDSFVMIVNFYSYGNEGVIIVYSNLGNIYFLI